VIVIVGAAGIVLTLFSSDPTSNLANSAKTITRTIYQTSTVNITRIVNVNETGTRTSSTNSTSSSIPILDSNYSTSHILIIPQNSSLAASSRVGSLDLEIVLTINATQLQTGQSLNVYAYDINTTTHSMAELSSFRDQKFNYSAAIAKIPCGSRPTVFSIYDGYYTIENVSQALPLQVFWPGGLSCPSTIPIFEITQSVYGYYDDTACNDTLYSTFCPHLVDFPDGNYTAAALDMYGGVALLYFKVDNYIPV
jgi:hypothetical protein